MKPKKQSFLNRLREANISKLDNIEDLPQENQTKMINSVLNAPCIPISLRYLIDKYPNNVNLNVSHLTEKELEEMHPFTPKFFIDLVMNKPRLLTTVAVQANLNTFMARAYECFVIDPDNLELEEFRGVCKHKYEDMQKLKTQLQTQEV